MKTKIILIAFILLSAIGIQAQNLEQALGGVKTNFKLFSGTNDLNPASQMIILKAERNSDTNTDFGTGWGYGYQSFHLEFVTSENLVEEKFRFKTGRDNDAKLGLTFYDSDEVILAYCQINFSDVDLLYDTNPGKTQYFYSIDLINIPIVLLNKTAKIDFKKLSSR